MKCVRTAALLASLLFAFSACAAPRPKAAAGTAPAESPQPAALPAFTPGSSNEYYVVDANQRKGVMDGLGRIVLPMRFASINILSQGYALTDKAPQNRPVLFFAVPADVSMGGAAADRRGMLYGADGKPVGGDQYLDAYPDDSPYIHVTAEESEEAWKTGLIDYSGKTLVPAQYGQVYEYSGGFVAVKGFREDKIRDVDIYNAHGSLVRSGSADLRDVLGDTLVVADSAGKLGFMDDRFQWVAAPQWDGVPQEGGGRFVVQKDGRQGVVDGHGAVILPVAYLAVSIPYDPQGGGQTVFAAESGGGVSLFDANGKQFFHSDKYIGLTYTGGILLATDSNNGMHALGMDGNEIIPSAGFINWNPLAQLFECSADGTSNGFIYYARDGHRLPLPSGGGAQYLAKDRFAFAATNAPDSAYGLCDGGGRILAPAQFSQIYPLGDSGFFLFGIAQADGKAKYGLMDSDGAVVLPAVYDSLYGGAGESLLNAKLGAVHGLIDTHGNWAWYASDYDSLED